jgi:hypothetical protein
MMIHSMVRTLFSQDLRPTRGLDRTISKLYGIVVFLVMHLMVRN